MNPLTTKQLILNLIDIALFMGSMAILLKFSTFLNTYVMFPAFPNILDILTLASTIVWFSFLKKLVKRNYQ